MGNDSDSQAYVVLFKDRHVVVPVYAGAGLRDVLDGRGECGKKQREKSTYVALTSSFAGTGGFSVCGGATTAGRDVSIFNTPAFWPDSLRLLTEEPSIVAVLGRGVNSGSTGCAA